MLALLFIYFFLFLFVTEDFLLFGLSLLGLRAVTFTGDLPTDYLLKLFSLLPGDMGLSRCSSLLDSSSSNIDFPVVSTIELPRKLA